MLITVRIVKNIWPRGFINNPRQFLRPRANIFPVRTPQPVNNIYKTKFKNNAKTKILETHNTSRYQDKLIMTRIEYVVYYVMFMFIMSCSCLLCLLHVR